MNTVPLPPFRSLHFSPFAECYARLAEVDYKLNPTFVWSLEKTQAFTSQFCSSNDISFECLHSIWTADMFCSKRKFHATFHISTAFFQPNAQVTDGKVVEYFFEHYLFEYTFPEDKTSAHVGMLL